MYWPRELSGCAGAFGLVIYPNCSFQQRSFPEPDSLFAQACYDEPKFLFSGS